MVAGLSSLTWPSPIGLWGWVKLQTCCTLSKQCAEVKPAITTFTQKVSHFRSYKYGIIMNVLKYTYPNQTCTKNMKRTGTCGQGRQVRQSLTCHHDKIKSK